MKKISVSVQFSHGLSIYFSMYDVNYVKKNRHFLNARALFGYELVV